MGYYDPPIYVTRNQPQTSLKNLKIPKRENMQISLIQIQTNFKQFLFYYITCTTLPQLQHYRLTQLQNSNNLKLITSQLQTTYAKYQQSQI